MTELWRPIAGHAGSYEISSLGRVRSLSRVLPDGRRWKGRVMALKPVNSGHLHVRLTSAGNFMLVHRLVLEAFVGPCPPGMEACHNNGNPADNRIENLRWDTRKSNHADKVRHGTSAHGERNQMAKLSAGDIGRVRDLSRFGITGRQIAAHLAVTPANISSILKGKTWTHISS